MCIQKRHQRLAHAQLGNGRLSGKLRIGAQGFRRRLDGLLVARGESAQGVLHTIAQLPKHAVGNVERVLRNEIHAHALGADQPHHLLHLLQQRRWRVGKQQVRFVKKEGQFRFGQITRFGQALEQFSQQPKQKGGVKRRGVHQLFGRQHVDDAFAILRLHQVFNVQHRLAEK